LTKLKLSRITWAFLSTSVQTWDEDVDCTKPPAFIRTDDDLLKPEYSNAIFNDPKWSQFPALGCLLNTGVYYCPKKMFGLVTVDNKRNGNYEARYWVVSGELKTPLIYPDSLVESTDDKAIYTWVAKEGFGILGNMPVQVEYKWGLECDALANSVVFDYKMSDAKTYYGYVNQIKMTRTWSGETPEVRQAFMVAAPQKIKTDPARHLITAVSMGNDNCASVDFMATYSNVEEYYDYLNDYVQKYFKIELDEGAMTAALGKAEACSASCKPEPSDAD